jgi:hypothetical protein
VTRNDATVGLSGGLKISSTGTMYLGDTAFSRNTSLDHVGAIINLGGGLPGRPDRGERPVRNR